MKLVCFKFSFFNFSFMGAKDESAISDKEVLDRELPIETPYWLKQNNTQKVNFFNVGNPQGCSFFLFNSQFLFHDTIAYNVFIRLNKAFHTYFLIPT